MNRFLQNFLRDSPVILSEVRSKLQSLSEQSLSDEAQTRQTLRQIFQQVHTLKGSAAAFGIEPVRALAHELENLLDQLCFGEIICDRAALNVLETGIEKIETALAAPECGNDIASPPDLPASIFNLTVAQTQAKSELDESHLPTEFFEKLSEREKRHLRQIAAGGATVFVLAVKFPLNSFQTMLQNLRLELERNGEIVATLPGTFASPAEIALQIVFVTDAPPPNFLITIKSFNGEILSAKQTPMSIAEAAATAFLAGRRAALELGKEITFDILGGELEITKKQATALTTALLHLVTNAVAHGIESPAERSSKKKLPCGTVRVVAELKAAAVCVSVTDDGRGIDFEKMALATEDVYDTADSEKMMLTQAQEKIFTLGFSTAETLTEVAGRGVGLSAAENAIKSISGTIQVKSEIGKGTTFEILIP